MPSRADFEAVLVRHGQTQWSVAGRHTGRTDVALTPEGEAEAAAASALLAGRAFELVLVSPLRRARQTCELAGYGAAAQVRADLAEWDYGDYEGLTSREIRQSNPDWNLWRDGCPGGESPHDVLARCQRIVKELGEVAQPGSGGVAVFAHGHILRALAATWCELPIAAGARLMLGTASLSTLGFEHSAAAIKHWNQTSK